MRGGDFVRGWTRSLCSWRHTASVVESDHPIPNLPALRAHLPPGLALEVVDALSDIESMVDASQIIADRLRVRVAAIEEGHDDTPDVG